MPRATSAIASSGVARSTTPASRVASCHGPLVEHERPHNGVDPPREQHLRSRSAKGKAALTHPPRAHDGNARLRRGAAGPRAAA